MLLSGHLWAKHHKRHCKWSVRTVFIQGHFEQVWMEWRRSSCRVRREGWCVLRSSALLLSSPLILLLSAHSLRSWKVVLLPSELHKTNYECLSLFWQHISTVFWLSCSFYVNATLCYTLLLVNHLTPTRKKTKDGERILRKHSVSGTLMLHPCRHVFLLLHHKVSIWRKKKHGLQTLWKNCKLSRRRNK